MTIPNNILIQVQTYQKAMLGYLDNLNVFVGELTNKKFKNFPGIQYNLGSSVTFDLPPFFTTTQGLVAVFQPAAQRLATLTCDQAANTSYAFTAQNKIFNVDKDTDNYMKEFGMSAVETLGAQIESNVALNVASAAPVMTINNQGQSVPTGALHTESGPVRFFGNASAPINSYQQLQQMIENFKEIGSTKDWQVVLPNTIIPAIIGSGLNQFAPNRNNEIANSWELGEFGSPKVKYYVSNLLPTHISGFVGDAVAPNNVFTVVSTNDPTGLNITQITATEPTGSTAAAAVRAGDLFQFNDGVAGQPNLRTLTSIGNYLTSQPVQFRAIADAASVAGTVVINLVAGQNAQQGNGIQSQLVNGTANSSQNILAGMKFTPLPSRKCGLMLNGKGFYLALPQLPDQSPFATGNEVDPETGASIRMTTGAAFGANQYGTVLDGTWGSLCLPSYSQQIAFPM
jgi:hypothetical protein